MVLKPVAVLLALGVSMSAAQQKATELTAGVIGLSYFTCSGCQGAFLVSTGGQNGVVSGLAGSSIGLGLYLSPKVSIEPGVSLWRLSGGGERSSTIIAVGAAVPFYFDKGWGRKGPYFAPRVAYNSVTSGGVTANQWSAGAALGTKVPLNDMAALRLQINADHGFESSDVSAATMFGALMGLSVFIR